MKKAVFVLPLLAALTGCKPSAGRYQIQAIPQGESALVARLDTMTGEVELAGFSQGGKVNRLVLIPAQNPPKP
ncbi:MAG: hypothetical protein ABIO94_10595 [Opitutaceae bacterium]